MKHVRMMGVAFFLLAMQLVCLPVKADDKADYLKLAQKVRQEVWDNTTADKKNAQCQRSTRTNRLLSSLITGS